MARWTEAEIAKFWEMKESGATLQEIADTLGRTLSSVENKSHEQIKKEVNTMPPTETPAPQEMSRENDSVRKAVEMVTALGLSLEKLSVSITKTGALLEIRFERTENATL